MKNKSLRYLNPANSGFTVLLGLIAGLPALSIDLSAPSLALLPVALDTSVFVAGLSLSLFVLGFGLGQFVGGRGSDQVGRRPVLLAALATYAFAGLCCAFAASGGQLATARLLQGIGAGGCSVQAYAMVQDLFTGEAARRKQAYVSVILTIMPMLAPALGAVIVLLFGWRVIHGAMAIGGLVLIGVVYTSVKESRPQRLLTYTGLGMVDSFVILKDPAFRRITIVNAFSYASIFAYIAGAPIVVISQFGFSNLTYAATFACTALALSGGAVTSARLGRRLDCRRLVWPALLLQAGANIGLIAAALMLSSGGLWLILPLLMAGCFARGIISPNLVHAAISRQREQAGLASAIVGVAQLALAAIASAVLARLLDPFGLVGVVSTMAGLTAVAMVLWLATDLGNLVEQRG